MDKAADTSTQKDYQKYRLLQELSGAVGKSRAVGMERLHRAVYGKPLTDKINGTRALRRLVTELRRDGVPICSVSNASGGGYYLASASSDLEDYCRRIRGQALKKLKMEANLRKMALPALLHQIQLNLDMDYTEVANAEQ